MTVSSLEGLQLAMERMHLDLLVIKRTRDKGQEPWHVAFGHIQDRSHGRLGTGQSLASAAEEAINTAESLAAEDLTRSRAIREERRVRQIAIGDYLVLGEAECIRVSDKAACLRLEWDDDVEKWFPLSTLRDGMYTGWRGEVVVKRWFAERENLT